MIRIAVVRALPFFLAIAWWYVCQWLYVSVLAAVRRRHVTRIRLHDKKVLLLHELPEDQVQRFNESGLTPDINVLWGGNVCIEESQWKAFLKSK